jgi:flagellar biosynthesis protein FliR
MMSIRRRTDAALLSYTDRGRVKLNVILGFVFGAIIGLFAEHLSLAADSVGNALGLSAVASLAGYNVPAVSDFLDDLSNRLFRPQERSASWPA